MMSDVMIYAYEVLDLIQEGSYAAAAVILFNIHKEDIPKWINLKGTLLSLCIDHQETYLVASLLNASSKETLMESACFIPGLHSLIEKHYES